MSSNSVSPQRNNTLTVNPMDEGEEEGSDDGDGRSSVRSTGGEVEMPQDEIDMRTEDRQAADGEVVDEPKTDHRNSGPSATCAGTSRAVPPPVAEGEGGEASTDADAGTS